MAVKISPHHKKVARQLTLLAGSCVLLVFTLFSLTQALVKKNEVDYLRASLSRVLPEGVTLGDFDNDVLASAKHTVNHIIYPACSKGKLHYALVEIETDKGYSGKIRLLTNIDARQNRLVASRPLFHQETPGLGDQIDPDKSDWLKQFSLSLNTTKKIAVDKDGGEIDSMTGATITSRAVSNVLAKQIFSLDLKKIHLCEAQQ